MAFLSFHLTLLIFDQGFSFLFRFKEKSSLGEKVKKEDISLELVFEGYFQKVALIRIYPQFFQDFHNRFFIFEKVDMQLVGIMFFYLEEGLVFVFLRRLRIMEGETESVLQFENYLYAFIYFFYLQIGVGTLFFVEDGFN